MDIATRGVMKSSVLSPVTRLCCGRRVWRTCSSSGRIVALVDPFGMTRKTPQPNWLTWIHRDCDSLELSQTGALLDGSHPKNSL